MDKIFINTKELAARWKVSPTTVKQWRTMNKGPQFFKMGGRASYRIEDIEEFERIRVITKTKKTDNKN